MDTKKVLLTFIKVGLTIVIVLAVIFAAKQLGSKGYDFGYRIFTEPAMEDEPGTDVLVQVKDGMKGKEIGTMLEEKGLIRDATLFALQLKLSAYSNDIAPGVYTLNTSMTAKDMIVVMATEEETSTEDTEAVTSSDDSDGTESTEALSTEE